MKSVFNRMGPALMGLMLAAMFTVGLMAPAPAQATALTDFAENKLIDALLRGQALGAPATMYIGLDTVACTDAGGGTEVTGGSYARVAVTSSLANWAGTQSSGSTTASSGTGGTTSNNGVISFPTPSAGWGTVVSVRWWDASTSGNAWICVGLTINKTINTGDTVTFPASTLTFQIDN
jgi:hypothetical protein